jgi:hypothetical protein
MPASHAGRAVPPCRASCVLGGRAGRAGAAGPGEQEPLGSASSSAKAAPSPCQGSRVPLGRAPSPGKRAARARYGELRWEEGEGSPRRGRLRPPGHAPSPGEARLPSNAPGGAARSRAACPRYGGGHMRQGSRTRGQRALAGGGRAPPAVRPRRGRRARGRRRSVRPRRRGEPRWEEGAGSPRRGRLRRCARRPARQGRLAPPGRMPAPLHRGGARRPAACPRVEGSPCRGSCARGQRPLAGGGRAPPAARPRRGGKPAGPRAGESRARGQRALAGGSLRWGGQRLEPPAAASLSLGELGWRKIRGMCVFSHCFLWFLFFLNAVNTVQLDGC